MNWLPDILKYHIKHFLPFEKNTLDISGQCYSCPDCSQAYSLQKVQRGTHFLDYKVALYKEPEEALLIQ